MLTAAVLNQLRECRERVERAGYYPQTVQWLRQQEQDQISRLQRQAQREVHNLLARLSRR